MDDAVVVGRFQRLGDLSGQFDRFFTRQRPVGKPHPQVGPWNELHDEEARALLLMQPVYRSDVWVIQ